MVATDHHQQVAVIVMAATMLLQGHQPLQLVVGSGAAPPPVGLGCILILVLLVFVLVAVGRFVRVIETVAILGIFIS